MFISTFPPTNKHDEQPLRSRETEATTAINDKKQLFRKISTVFLQKISARTKKAIYLQAENGKEFLVSLKIQKK
jgi:hypothetical protein